MRSQVIRKLILAQLCYFGFLAISIFINRGGFRNNHGLSFYGEHLQTLVPYGLGTIGCGLFLLQAAHLLPQREDPYRILRFAMQSMAILLFLLLVTPDTLGQFLNISHEIVAFMLFTGELGLAAWITFCWCRGLANCILLLMQFGGGLAAMFSEFNVIAYLSESSLVFQLSFTLLLMRALAVLLSQEHILTLRSRIPDTDS